MEQNHIQEIICKILLLQQQEFDPDLTSCDRPFLGPVTPSNIYNTRPVQLYNAYTAEAWSFTTTDGATSNIFRIESTEPNTVTVRLLTLDPTTSGYTNTNQFATINTSTIGAIRCLADTYIAL